MTSEQPTARELACLAATVEHGGYSPAAATLRRLADDRPVSAATVRAHVRAARAKLGASTTAQAFLIAVRRGYLDPHGTEAH